VDPNSGRIVPVPDELQHEVEIGQLVPTDLMRRLAEHEATNPVDAETINGMLEEARHAVCVSGDVAQKVKLGERELDRRERRRAARRT
jgi:hypothetical protein